MIGQTQGGAIADRTAADHHHRMTPGFKAVFQRRQLRRMPLRRKWVGNKALAHAKIMADWLCYTFSSV